MKLGIDFHLYEDHFDSKLFTISIMSALLLPIQQGWYGSGSMLASVKKIGISSNEIHK